MAAITSRMTHFGRPFTSTITQAMVRVDAFESFVPLLGDPVAERLLQPKQKTFRKARAAPRP